MNVRRTHTIVLSFQGVRTEMVAMNVSVKTDFLVTESLVVILTSVWKVRHVVPIKNV